MDYRIDYYSDTVQAQIVALPDTLAARYIVLTRRMVALSQNIGECRPASADFLVVFSG